MNRTTKVRFPIFSDYEVRIIQARDVTATGRRLHVDLSDAKAAFVYPQPPHDKRGWIVFGMEPDADVIAHEASHAVRAVFNFVGAKTDNETFAYHLGYLVGRIHKFLEAAR